MASMLSTVIALLLLVVFVYILIAACFPSSQTQARSRTRPRRHTVTQQQIDAVHQMFPHYTREAIDADLAVTGSVQETCDRILGGVLIAPQPPPQPPQQQQTENQQKQNPIPYVYTDTVTAPPPKTWDKTPEGRHENLKMRKAFMVQEARRKMLERESASGGGTSK